MKLLPFACYLLYVFEELPVGMEIWNGEHMILSSIWKRISNGTSVRIELACLQCAAGVFIRQLSVVHVSEGVFVEHA